MSTTADRDVAVKYSGIVEGKPTATVLQLKASSVNRPACIEQFSQYPGEREYLWVPLSYMQPDGAEMLEASGRGVLRIVNVDVSSNGTAATTEDLLERKKQLHVKGFEALMHELTLELRAAALRIPPGMRGDSEKLFENIMNGSEVVYENLHLGPDAQEARRVEGVKDVLARHREKSAGP